MPNGIEIESEFGYYKIDFKIKNSSTLVLQENIVLRKDFMKVKNMKHSENLKKP